jgi:trans-AT polyketide synthase/acyltransferase/oxidoreductase domain-containing protein
MTTFIFPGQGSQIRGMGDKLFGLFEEVTARADAILGYSVATLCLEDPEHRLNQTEYTQPALFVVSALSYMHRVSQGGRAPDYLAGHSLGEYAALFASGVFDFETGLRLVQRRGQLMSEARGGGMAAVIGLDEDRIAAVLTEHGLSEIDIANYNAPSQFVVSGLRQHLDRARAVFEAEGATFIPLNVSAAFHSRQMQPAAESFGEFLDTISFSQTKIPVISNVFAQPYEHDRIKETLQTQIMAPVRWTQTIKYLIEHGETQFEELGPGDVLTKLVQKIKPESQPAPSLHSASPAVLTTVSREPAASHRLTPEALGSQFFRERFNLKYAYVAGAMYKGIASKQLVVTLARAGLLGYFGTGGLPISEIEKAIRSIQAELSDDQAYGMNLLYSLERPELEEQTVDLFLRLGVNNVEAASYIEMTPALVRFRLHGLREQPCGNVTCDHRVLAKVSRTEVAEAFLSPAPPDIIARLLAEGKVTAEQARLSSQVPMADALCAEADSGGHTDQAVAMTLVPSIVRLRDEFARKLRYAREVHVGAAGGIGTPEAVAAAFILGADFVLTGSINQCTVEAGTSDAAKDLLQRMDVRDTTYAPAGDMFELGARIQVLKKGLFFPARANKLYALYCQHSSLEALDQKTRNELEDKYFRRSLAAVWEETRAYYLAHDPEQVERAERDAKHKMALVFRWYFVHTMRLALNGSKDQQVDYQVHCGPALGAFNRWVKGTELENWRNRHVDVIAERLMQATAVLLGNRFQSLYGLRQEDEGLAQPSLSAAHSVHAGSRADCIDDPGVTSKISGRS